MLCLVIFFESSILGRTVGDERAVISDDEIELFSNTPLMLIELALPLSILLLLVNPVEVGGEEVIVP